MVGFVVLCSVGVLSFHSYPTDWPPVSGVEPRTNSPELVCLPPVSRAVALKPEMPSLWPAKTGWLKGKHFRASYDSRKRVIYSWH